MLRSLYEGYIPCVLLAAFGYSMVGGSFFGWAAFVWIFGAVLTVVIAFLKTRPVDVAPAAQPVPVRVENY